MATLACVLVLAGCSASSAGPGGSVSPVPPVVRAPALPTPSPGSDYVLLDFDGADPLTATSPGSTVEVRREGDAPVQTTRSGDGTRGLVFPAYARTGEGRLVLLLRAGSTPHATSPPAELVFGADVELGAGPGSGPADNGDNVVQRGLYADQDQFKLQVDERVPSCTVRTPRLRAFVKLGHPLGSGWYRLSCAYDGVTLDLQVTPMSGTSAEPVRASTPAAAGALAFPATTGISIGGKVTAGGDLVETQPDQFNGVLDNVFVSPSP